MSTTPPADYDSPWKDALERYFADFVALFFPDADAEIDWSRGYEFLDKELQQVVREAEVGPRVADKLVRVFLRDGGEAWVLVHVEVQAQVDAAFPRRMHVYNYRIFDRYDRPVASFAVLADDRHGWRPSGFAYELWGSRSGTEFRTVKLLDHEAALEQDDDNPFALIALAHLKAIRTQRDPNRRLHWKVTLLRKLYRQGRAKEEVRELFRFLDWLLALPEELTRRFDRALEELEEEVRMPFVTPRERAIQEAAEVAAKAARETALKENAEAAAEAAARAAVEARQESVLEVLDARLGTVPDAIAARVREVHDLDRLKRLNRLAGTVDSLAAFESGLGRGA